MTFAQATVFVVDDDKAIRDSLCWLIGSVGLAVESFDCAQQFLAAYRPEQAGCLVLDVRLPGTSGLELQERLRTAGVMIPVIIITGHGDVSSAVRAMKAGAVDFIEKPFNDQILLERVHRAVELDRHQRAHRSEQDHIRERISRLTPRERQVLQLVVAGKANKQIASELKLSPKTVEVHRANVMLKMRARNVADLVRMAMLTQALADSPVMPAGVAPITSP